MNDKKDAKSKLHGYKKNLIWIFVILFLTFYFAIDVEDLAHLPKLLSQVDPVYLVIALGVMFGIFLVQAWVEQVLLKSLGYQTGLGQCYSYSLTDYYFSIITPAAIGGQPAQIYYMSRDGIDPGSSALVMLIFNGLYHAAVLVVVGLSMVGRFQTILAGQQPYQAFFFIGIIVQALLMILFALLIFSPGWLTWIKDHLVPLVGKFNQERARRMEEGFDHTQKEYAEGSAWVKKNPKVILKLFPSLILYIFMLYSEAFWVSRAMGIGGHSIWEMVAYQGAYTMTYECLPIPSGVGLAELSFLTIFSSVYKRGEVAFAMLLTRFISHYLFLLVGGFTALLSHRKQETGARAKSLVKDEQ